jgi:hypothetical protein
MVGARQIFTLLASQMLGEVILLRLAFGQWVE